MSIDQHGNKRWRNDAGMLHREGGPAVIWWNGSKSWFRNGERHREDGPAVERQDGYREWWIHGRYYYILENWAQQVLILQNKQVTDEAVVDLIRQVERNNMMEML